MDSGVENLWDSPDRRFRFKVNSTLCMLHSALQHLGSFTSEVRQWKQAHCRARFAILRAVLIWGCGAVSAQKIDGKFKLTIDPAKFDGVVDAVELLQNCAVSRTRE
jgi:hypothetical protein